MRTSSTHGRRDGEEVRAVKKRGFRETGQGLVGCLRNERCGNLVVLWDLVGGQNGPKRTMLSCQTLGQSKTSIRYLNVSDLKYPNKFALLIVV